MNEASKEAWRRRVRRDRPQLRAIVHEWNPIGVGGLPEDEYDCLVDHLLSKLYGGATEAEIVALVEHEIHDHFGLSNEASDIQGFVARVLEWFRLASPETEDQSSTDDQ